MFIVSKLLNVFLDLRKSNQYKTEPQLGENNAVELMDIIADTPVIKQTDVTVKQYTHTILLVEDDTEVRDYIKDILEPNYQVFEAENGLVGLEALKHQKPDLIISDVTMPEMDGLEFCAKIKTNEDTNHIPVILLTGNVKLQDQVSCLKNGADVYLTKPFNTQALQLNIQNLLSLSDKMQQRFSKRVSLEPNNVLIDEKEEEFMYKVLNVVEENISNTEFGVHHLASEIGMSSPVFYKKMQFLTGMSVNNFMKSIKLKRAAQLLKQNHLTVYQVAYEVGFKDSKYFSREFKKQFGQSPSNYNSF